MSKLSKQQEINISLLDIKNMMSIFNKTIKENRVHEYRNFDDMADTVQDNLAKTLRALVYEAETIRWHHFRARKLLRDNWTLAEHCSILNAELIEYQRSRSKECDC